MRTLFFLFAFIVSNLIHAQKGSFLVSGNFGFSSDKESFTDYDGTVNDFKITSKAGYQISNNFTLGIEVAYANANTKVNYPTYKAEIDDDIYNFGGFVRYSKSLGGIFSFLTDLSVGKVIETRDYPATNESGTQYYYYKKRGYFFVLNPSILIEIKNKFGLTFSLGGLKYVDEKMVDENFDTQPIDSNYKASSLDFTFGKSIEIGIQKSF